MVVKKAIIMSNKSKGVRTAARHADIRVATVLHHTSNPLTVRRSEKENTPNVLLKSPVRFEFPSNTSERTTHQRDKTQEVTTVSFEQARAVAEQVGCDWTRLDEVIACFVQARLLMSRQRHELYEHAKTSESD